MNKEMIEYTKLAHKADTERGRCTPFNHKWTKEEGEQVASMKWVRDQQYSPDNTLEAVLCDKCNYYHLMQKHGLST